MPNEFIQNSWDNMTDWDTIWHKQDEIRTAVNAVLGESIWDISYVSSRQAIEMELTVHLDEEAASHLCCQLPLPADYDGEGDRGTKFILYL